MRGGCALVLWSLEKDSIELENETLSEKTDVVDQHAGL